MKRRSNTVQEHPYSLPTLLPFDFERYSTLLIRLFDDEDAWRATRADTSSSTSPSSNSSTFRLPKATERSRRSRLLHSSESDWSFSSSSLLVGAVELVESEPELWEDPEEEEAEGEDTGRVGSGIGIAISWNPLCPRAASSGSGGENNCLISFFSSWLRRM